MKRLVWIFIIAVLSLTAARLSGAAVSTTERNALIDLYQSTNGAGWTENDGWLGAAGTEGDWYGVSVENDTVVGLHLENNGLTGTLPTSLGNFPNLRILSVYNNDITGPIPETIGNLPLLETLYMCCNRFTGTLPAALGNLSNLVRFHAHANQLEGTIPAAYANLSRIEELILYDNQFSGTIPAFLGGLANMRELMLDSNNFTGTISTALGQLANLEVLELQYNNLEGAIPTALSALGNLRTLKLHGNNLSGPIPTWLNQLSRLEYLALSNNPLGGTIPTAITQLANLQRLFIENAGITGTIPAALGNLTGLLQLELDGNELTGGIPPELGNLSNLEYLQLGGNQLTGSIPATLGNLTRLKDLYIQSNDLSGAIPVEITRLPALENLNLSQNQYSGPVPTTLTNLPVLKELDLSNNAFTGSIPPELGGMTTLTHLSLYENDLSGTIPSELGNLVNLEILYLCCNNFTGSIPSALGNLSRLERLNLDSNQLTGEIPDSLGNLTNLITLDLSDNQLTGGISTTLTGLTNLTSLRLNDNPLGGTIPAGLQNLNRLEYLNLGRCDLTGTIPEWFGSAYPSLLVLDLDQNHLEGAIPAALGNIGTLTYLDLAVNLLRGPVPPALANLTQLGEKSLDLRYNALYTTDPSLSAFLSQRHMGTEAWSDTQTLPPADLTAGVPASRQVPLSWTPINFAWGNGVYEVHAGTAPGGPFSLHTTTDGLYEGEINVQNLEPGVTYYFTVRTRSDFLDVGHTLYSDFTGVVSVTTTVGNNPPSADAGGYQTVKHETVVQLDATQSYDPDGNLSGYFWEQIEGPSVILSDPASNRPTFTAPAVDLDGEKLAFKLTVTDSMGVTDEAYTEVMVYQVDPPRAAPGPDQHVIQGEPVVLDATPYIQQSEFYSYLWEQLEGPAVSLSNPSAPTTSFTAPAGDAGGERLVFRFTVTDSRGPGAEDYTAVYVYQQYILTAEAGDNRAAGIGQPVTLSASGSIIPAGIPVTYAWTQIQGPAVTLSDSSSPAPSFTAPAVDADGTELVFQLTLTGDSGQQSTDTVSIYVISSVSAPTRPEAISPAGESIVGTGGVMLEISGFSDPDGDAHFRTYWEVRRFDRPHDYGFYLHVAEGGNLTQHWYTNLTPGMKYLWNAGVQDDSASGEMAWTGDSAFKAGEYQSHTGPAVPAGTEKRDYRIISFPFWMDNPDPYEVFGQAVADQYGLNYRLGTYDEEFGGYREFWEGLLIEPGVGLWVLARNGLTPVITGVPVTTDTPVDVPLSHNTDTGEGWNMIGPPNNADYRWTDVEVVVYDDSGGVYDGPHKIVSAENIYVDPRLWRYEGGDYYADTSVLQAFTGYWVKVDLDENGTDLGLKISLRFPQSARQRAGEGFPYHRTQKTAPADADSPPPPPGAIGPVEEGDVGGCYIRTLN